MKHEKSMTDGEVKGDRQINALAHVSRVSMEVPVRVDSQICRFEVARERLKSATGRNAVAG